MLYILFLLIKHYIIKHLYCLLLVCILSVPAFSKQLRVAVAANAQSVAVKLKEAFKKETSIDAALTVNSSGKLTARIEQGAPFNVFMYADMKYPNELFSKGLTTAKPKVYAYGTLVMWTFANRDISNGLSAVLNDSINKIAVANPKLAPYGEATIQALTKQNLLQKAEPKIGYGESIAHVNQCLLSGAADIAFTANSVVLDSALSGKGKWIEISSKLYNPIAQGMVVIKSTDADGPALANRFYNFLFSKAAKAIFLKYGYK